MPRDAHLRVARPTADLEKVTEMYRNGLGLEELGSFRDHEGFAGVMLGNPGTGYHLEFTCERDAPPPAMPDRESLLVFYLPDAREWDDTCRQMIEVGFQTVPSHNPYWDGRGRTFEDPDGYRVVLQNAEWPQAERRTD